MQIVVIPQADVVDDVPRVGDILNGPKRFARILGDVVDGRVGVVHQQIQLAVLLALDLVEQVLDLSSVRMIH